MIRRSPRPRRNFTIIDNVVLNDERLSFKGTGLLAFLLAKPDDWAIDEQALTRCKTDGRYAVSQGLKELEAAGYIARRRYRDPSTGQFGCESVLFDTPQLAAEAQAAFDADEEGAGGTARDNRVRPDAIIRDGKSRPAYIEEEQRTDNKDDDILPVDNCDQCDNTGWVLDAQPVTECPCGALRRRHTSDRVQYASQRFGDDTDDSRDVSAHRE